MMPKRRDIAGTTSTQRLLLIHSDMRRARHTEHSRPKGSRVLALLHAEVAVFACACHLQRVHLHPPHTRSVYRQHRSAVPAGLNTLMLVAASLPLPQWCSHHDHRDLHCCQGRYELQKECHQH